MIFVNIIRFVVLIIGIGTLSILFSFIKSLFSSSTSYEKIAYEHFIELKVFKTVGSTFLFFAVVIFALGFSIYSLTLPTKGTHCFYAELTDNKNKTVVLPAEIIITEDYDEHEYTTMLVSRIFWSETQFEYIDYNLYGVHFYEEFHYDDMTIRILKEKTKNDPMVVDKTPINQYVYRFIDIFFPLFIITNSIFYFTYKKKNIPKE